MHFLSSATFALGVASVLCAETKQSVLILDSYHPGYTWSDDEISGLRAALKEGQRNVEIYVEFVDSQRHSGPDYDSSWNAFTLAKYRNIPIDLIDCRG